MYTLLPIFTLAALMTASADRIDAVTPAPMVITYGWFGSRSRSVVLAHGCHGTLTVNFRSGVVGFGAALAVNAAPAATTAAATALASMPLAIANVVPVAAPARPTARRPVTLLRRAAEMVTVWNVVGDVALSFFGGLNSCGFHGDDGGRRRSGTRAGSGREAGEMKRGAGAGGGYAWVSRLCAACASCS